MCKTGTGQQVAQLHDRLMMMMMMIYYYYYYYYYRYSALGPVWAKTRVQSGDWYGSGTLHPGQVLRGSLPLLSPYICNIYKGKFHPITSHKGPEGE